MDWFDRTLHLQTRTHGHIYIADSIYGFEHNNFFFYIYTYIFSLNWFWWSCFISFHIQIQCKKNERTNKKRSIRNQHHSIHWNIDSSNKIRNNNNNKTNHDYIDTTDEFHNRIQSNFSTKTNFILTYTHMLEKCHSKLSWKNRDIIMSHRKVCSSYLFIICWVNIYKYSKFYWE